ncbi:MAG: hypothetical protein NC252_09410 [Roseburia sp.]|nr:hypothetical protein [Roseburia sp.]MCM1422108.1 hypothetical protein [Bacteroides sp.]
MKYKSGFRKFFLRLSESAFVLIVMVLAVGTGGLWKEVGFRLSVPF